MTRLSRFLLLLFAIVASAVVPLERAATAAEPDSPGRLVAVIAVGSQDQLDRLAALSKEAGFPAQQLDGPEGRELMMMFPNGSSQAAIDTFVAQLKAERFANVALRYAILPKK